MKSILTQLTHELDLHHIPKQSIKSLFIGGGTPSVIKPHLYQKFFEKIAPFMAKDSEITSEANPNSATKDWLEGMRQLGVNRISFGVQSFDTKKLHSLGRAHTSNEAIVAIENCANVGFENISLDLIYDCFQDTKELLKNDIDIATSLPINHLSAYELTIEDGTKFTQKNRNQKDTFAFFVAEEIISHGFNHYEISNFGTYQCKHNLGYWRLEEYIGIGAGAIGYINNTRYAPSRDIARYISSPLEYTYEALTHKEWLTEKIFLGLRSVVGIEKSILPLDIHQKAELLVQHNKLTQTSTFFYNLDYFLSDEIALYLMP